MLEDIKGNIAQLIAMYESEKMRADALAARVEQSEAEVEACKTQITELNGRIDNLKLESALVGGSANPAEAKARIDSLIHEIDKCIKLLEK